jgi:hypothetical protein
MRLVPDDNSTEAGLIDLRREQLRDRREWTWRSPRKGLRIIKAFIASFPAFWCTIDHAPRQSELRDHSAVVLEAD